MEPKQMPLTQQQQDVARLLSRAATVAISAALPPKNAMPADVLWEALAVCLVGTVLAIAQGDKDFVETIVLNLKHAQKSS